MPTPEDKARENIDWLLPQAEWAVRDHKRDRATRAVRWEQLDEDLEYDVNQLDRDVVTPARSAPSSSHTGTSSSLKSFPAGSDVPKTRIFAKDNSYAEDMGKIVCEEFGKGNDFAQKITYRIGKRLEEIIAEFRNSYFSRVAVAVDMIATDTDVKPLEVVSSCARSGRAVFSSRRRAEACG